MTAGADRLTLGDPDNDPTVHYTSYADPITGSTQTVAELAGRGISALLDVEKTPTNPLPSAAPRPRRMRP